MQGTYDILRVAIETAGYSVRAFCKEVRIGHDTLKKPLGEIPIKVLLTLREELSPAEFLKLLKDLGFS